MHPSEMTWVNTDPSHLIFVACILRMGIHKENSSCLAAAVPYYRNSLDHGNGMPR